MQKILIIILVGSILFNLVAIWGFFHYIKYGGSPLGELKRKLTGATKQRAQSPPFAEDNARLMAEPDSMRIVFLGASITRRWDLQKYFPEFRMINRGLGGQFMPEILTRFKRDVIDIKPKAVIIKLCSINIRPSIPTSLLRDGMIMMSEMANSHGIIPILATIIPAGKPEAHIGDFSVVDSLRGYNDWLRAYASDNSFPLIDFAKAIEDPQGFLPRECSADPVHVNEKGYGILAEAAKPVISSVLARKQ